MYYQSFVAAFITICISFLISGCDVSEPEESCATGLNGVAVEDGHFAVAIESGGDCHIIEGTASYEPGGEGRNNLGPFPLFVARLFSTETELVLWFARVQEGIPAVGEYQITDLPDKPTGSYETRFVTSAESVSSTGIHVSRDRGYSEGGTFTVVSSENGSMEVRFTMTMGLEPSDETATVTGSFVTMETETGLSINP